MDIEERVQKATEAHIARYNCVQSVLMGYEDLFDSMEDIITATMGIGRGVGQSYEICGTVLGGAMVISKKFGGYNANREQKHDVEQKIKKFIDEFREDYGAVTCGDLLGITNREVVTHKRPCREMVQDVVRRVDKYVN